MHTLACSCHYMVTTSTCHMSLPHQQAKDCNSSSGCSEDARDSLLHPLSQRQASSIPQLFAEYLLGEGAGSWHEARGQSQGLGILHPGEGSHQQWMWSPECREGPQAIINAAHLPCWLPCTGQLPPTHTGAHMHAHACTSPHSHTSMAT